MNALRLGLTQREAIAQQKIIEALTLASFSNAEPCLPSEDIHLHEAHEKLTRGQVRDGILALMLALKIPSGNSGGRNLYELIDLYLRNPEATEEINQVIERFGFKVMRG